MTKHDPAAEESFQALWPQLEDNISYIEAALYETEDLKVRPIAYQQREGCLIYLDTMINPQELEQSFLQPLAVSPRRQPLKQIITSADYSKTKNLNEGIKKLLSGHTLLLLSGEEEVYCLFTPEKNARTPEEPENEKVIRGSHQGFVESIDINLNLIRQRIQNRQLKVKYFELGTESNTRLALVYMANIANREMVDKIEARLEEISIDIIVSPGYIEEMIEEYPLSPFPQNLYTERPDRLKAHLMEGRVAIMADGSSDSIILPVSFFAFFQSPDDYNNRYFEGSFFRILRIISFWGTLILPALYVAVVGFHFEIIPFDMINLVKESVDVVPLPPLSEAILMAVTIELIREAGIRLPTPIGQTIGIVGGLIIGDAVVKTGLVSNVVIIVIALTAIMSYAISSYEIGNVARILSYPILLGAASLGFVGIVFTLMLIVIHMCKLQSLGVPYIAPLSPFNWRGLKDSFVRQPIWLIKKRPKYLQPIQRDRDGRSLHDQ